MSDAIFADPHKPTNGHSQDCQDEGRQIYTTLHHSLRPYHVEHGFDSDVFLNNSQSRENVHFAGHGDHDTVNGSGLFFRDRCIHKGDIQAQYKPSKLFFASCCKSYHDNQLADHYLNNGSECFIGYKDSPASDKAESFAVDFYEEWVTNGKSAKDAFNDTRRIYQSLQGNVFLKQKTNGDIYY